jgi:hypothetical protein
MFTRKEITIGGEADICLPKEQILPWICTIDPSESNSKEGRELLMNIHAACEEVFQNKAPHITRANIMEHFEEACKLLKDLGTVSEIH